MKNSTNVGNYNHQIENFQQLVQILFKQKFFWRALEDFWRFIYVYKLRWTWLSISHTSTKTLNWNCCGRKKQSQWNPPQHHAPIFWHFGHGYSYPSQKVLVKLLTNIAIVTFPVNCQCKSLWYSGQWRS